MLTLYTQDRCNWCDRLKEKLKEWGHEYTEINIKNDQSAKDLMRRKIYCLFFIMSLNRKRIRYVISS